jgi:hypothetical protein
MGVGHPIRRIEVAALMHRGEAELVLRGLVQNLQRRLVVVPGPFNALYLSLERLSLFGNTWANSIGEGGCRIPAWPDP